ncbi:hypothetical protein AQZ52_03490 [Novosphingobium fuchskuhlense]|uniref:Uncharacterized protein n=1 Tax=Novosphingobium fuchskuhlense TaxID=1117702 RepID=A0A117UWV0_9SPHN|nr:hypothetical protein [Novosphingobium fuchskuhlense]KUR72341.1 hypothetical protein AQZ52_03490 [Novosphingobium fuchskuhlense]
MVRATAAFGKSASTASFRSSRPKRGRRYRQRVTQEQFLVSDRFWNALKAAGCAGWRPASFQRSHRIPEV